MKRSSGSWKKERASGRKYSKSDSHKEPNAFSRKRIWVSDSVREGKAVKGTFRKAPKR